MANSLFANLRRPFGKLSFQYFLTNTEMNERPLRQEPERFMSLSINLFHICTCTLRVSEELDLHYSSSLRIHFLL